MRNLNYSELLNLVKSLEWIGRWQNPITRLWYQVCPRCGGMRPDFPPNGIPSMAKGHSSQCRIKQALAKS